MKKLLVTGVSGFLGWNLCQLLKGLWDTWGAYFAHPIVIPGVTVIRADLTDFRELKSLFAMIRPDAVMHIAAVADPNLCQLNGSYSYRVNVEASLNIAGLCADRSITCVYTSSDLVFDGLNAPYREGDAVCPVNIYGEHKVLAEEGMCHRYPKVKICRMPLMFGNPPATAVSFIQAMIKAMHEGRELKLFTDEWRTPISAKVAAEGLAITLQKGEGIIHLGGRERISRFDFGRLLAEALCLNASITPCKQRDVPMAAPRPPDVSLDNSKAVALGFNPLPLKKDLLVNCIDA
jgi:dTDP-4-dehydrorhamnose reductase